MPVTQSQDGFARVRRYFREISAGQTKIPTARRVGLKRSDKREIQRGRGGFPRSAVEREPSESCAACARGGRSLFAENVRLLQANKRRTLAVSRRSDSTVVGACACNASSEWPPVATAMVRAPIA